MKKLDFGICMGLLLLALTALSACGQKHGEEDGHDHGSESHEKAERKEAKHDDHDHGEEEHKEGESASYEEGKGVFLPEETRKAFGLEVVKASEGSVLPSVSLNAQVYRSSTEASRAYGSEREGFAYATAFLSPEVATKLKLGQKLTFLPKSASDSSRQGTVWKIISAQVPVFGKAEALLELSDKEGRLSVGEFVEAKIPVEAQVQRRISIPRSAVLSTSTGNYVFVERDHFFLRVEVQLGAQNDSHVEVSEGVQVDDMIVVKPVEALYLIELRVTKGGGHAH